ncbi:MAG: pseudouridine synthase [Candidatus Verstraetearchaeota archaeon]|nr:pseudouridine synthase [Candidatus Verstraetearchaeota archaeon]
MPRAGPTFETPTSEELRRLRGVADYQFGRGAGDALFPDGIQVIRSKKTGKIKGILVRGELIATLKPSDGYLALSIAGGKALMEALPPPKSRVVAMDEVSDFIKEGRNLFAKHVVSADPNIRPGDEVVITNSNGTLLAVGRAVLNAREMKYFKTGLAVNVRRGNGSE